MNEYTMYLCDYTVRITHSQLVNKVPSIFCMNAYNKISLNSMACVAVLFVKF